MSLVRLATCAVFAGAALVHPIAAAQAGECRDPIVTQAIREVTGTAPRGAGETLDCNAQNYNNGHWTSYAELLGFVRAKANGRNGSEAARTVIPGVPVKPTPRPPGAGQ
jgi:hypothetical protein